VFWRKYDLLKITRIWPYIDYFGYISCHFWWFLSFGVLAKAQAALEDLVYVLWQNNLRLFKNFRSPEESKILLKTHFPRNRLIIANFHWIFTDSCHICWFRVSVFWQKHELLCGIWCKFCDKTIWDYLKIFEVLRNPRFSRKHNSHKLSYIRLFQCFYIDFRVIFADFRVSVFWLWGMQDSPRNTMYQKFIWNVSYITDFVEILYHICKFSSFSVLEKARAALRDLV